MTAAAMIYIHNYLTYMPHPVSLRPPRLVVRTPARELLQYGSFSLYEGTFAVNHDDTGLDDRLSGRVALPPSQCLQSNHSTMRHLVHR